MEIIYFDIDDFLNDFKENEHLNKTCLNEATLLENQKENLIGKINEKMFNLPPNKSVLILVDNFHYFFSTNELAKLSMSILNELLTIKKKTE